MHVCIRVCFCRGAGIEAARGDQLTPAMVVPESAANDTGPQNGVKKTLRVRTQTQTGSYPLYIDNRVRRNVAPVPVVGPDGTNVPHTGTSYRDSYYGGDYVGAYSAYNAYSAYAASRFPLEVYFPSVLFTESERPRERLKRRSYDYGKSDVPILLRSTCYLGLLNRSSIPASRSVTVD